MVEAKSIFFYLLFFLCALGCREENNLPLDCLNEILEAETKTINIGNSVKKFRIPKDWAVSDITKDSVNVTCLDTFLLFKEEITKSITFSNLGVRRNNIDDFISQEIASIEEKWKILGTGKQNIKNIKVDWIMFSDNQVLTIVFYFFHSQTYLATLRTDYTSGFENRLCELIFYLNTFED